MPEIFPVSFVDTAKGSHNTPQVSTVSCCVGEFYPARNVFKRRLTIERNQNSQMVSFLDDGQLRNIFFP